MGDPTLRLTSSAPPTILVVIMDALSRAVARALADAPSSLRALARAAGVSHVTLLQVRQGTLPASPTVAAKVARALTGWGTKCQRAASRITRTLGDT